MKIFELNNYDILHLSNSSKGVQVKWKTRDGIWIKRDTFGYEGLAEYLSSEILHLSNANTLGYDFVEYGICKIKDIKEDKEYRGCYSYDFIKDGGELISIAYILKRFRIQPPNNLSTKDSINFLVKNIEGVTGIKNFGAWLTFVLEFDSFILNEDRHLGNLAVLRTSNGFKLAPIFDNGLSLLSDIVDYPWDAPLIKNIRNVKSKPFSKDFKKQVNACRELYGRQFKYGGISLFNNIEIYGHLLLKRVKDTLDYQLKENLDPKTQEVMNKLLNNSNINLDNKPYTIEQLAERLKDIPYAIEDLTKDMVDNLMKTK